MRGRPGNMKRGFTAVLIVAGVVLACWVPAGAVASRSDTTCLGLPGKPWKDLYGKTGTKYDVSARGVTCAFVKPWVVKLSGTHKPTQLLAGGPSGWRCVAQGGAKALGFVCSQGGKGFYANPSGGSNSG
jgi:hypothetical protein